MISEEEKQDLLIAKAFEALNADDEKTLHQLLLENPELTAEIENWRETVGMLALSAPVAEPSAKVRENILAMIREDKEVEGLFDQIVDKKEDSPNLQFKADPTVTLQEIAQTKRNFWSLTQKMMAVAACLAIAFLGFSVWKTRNDLALSNSEIAKLKEKLTSTETELAKASELLTPNTVSATLAGLEDAPNAKAKLIYDKASGKAYLIVEGLPLAPQGKAYQLWYIAGKAPVSGGVFKASADGKGELRGEIPADERQSSTIFAVTLEPEQGVPAPTGKMFLKTAL